MRKWLCLLVLLTSACGSIPSREAYAERVYYWQGRDANALLAQWGAPNKSMTMPNGNLLYTYSKSYSQQQPYFDNRHFEPGSRFTVLENGQPRLIETPGRWVYDGPVGGGIQHYSCITNFVVNAKTQLVESVSFDGNDCLAVPNPNP